MKENLTKGNWKAAVGHKAHHGRIALKEAQTLLEVLNGATNKVGARNMGISPSTFGSNLSRAMYKLNTYTRAETVAEAIRQGVISTLLIIISFQSLMPASKEMIRPQPRVRHQRIVRIRTRRKYI